MTIKDKELFLKYKLDVLNYFYTENYNELGIVVENKHKEKYFIKQWGEKRFNNMLNELFIKELYQPDSNSSFSGDYFIRTKDKYFTISKYMDLPQNPIKFDEIIFEFHNNTSLKKVPDRKNYFFEKIKIINFINISQIFDSKQQLYIKLSLDIFKKNVLPHKEKHLRSFIHGDVRINNILKKNEKNCLIDFEFSRHDWFIIEFLSLYNSSINYDEFEKIVHGYNNVYYCFDLELQFLDTYLFLYYFIIGCEFLLSNNPNYKLFFEIAFSIYE